MPRFAVNEPTAPPSAIIATPLTAQAFSPFGEVIEACSRGALTINDGSARRFDDLARIDTGAQGGRTGISIFVGQPFTLPVSIRLLERHPLGSQAFMPLDARRYLVVVAADVGDRPGPPIAFLAAPGQGVSYARGTWHHPLIALDAPSRFLVVDRIGPGENCEVCRYPSNGHLVSVPGT